MCLIPDVVPVSQAYPLVSPSPSSAPVPLAAAGTRERRILVIEDEADLALLLQVHLSELPAQVFIATDGEQGLAMALAEEWDAIVLDLRLPKLGGLEVCREIRARGRYVPIMMLTARTTELDRVLGLELGADDYLTKPFSMLELQARIKALLRRASHFNRTAEAALTRSDAVLQLGALHLDYARRRASLAGTDLVLTPREWDLLWFFAQQPGRVFSRSELLEKVWGYGHDGYDHTVNSHINRLRSKLGDDRSNAHYIHTVWGTGYRFEPPA
jgi:DNA-binding response OmpR family regulator